MSFFAHSTDIALDYSINLGAWRSVFAVPGEVVDKHLRLAGAAQLRALLYILRHSDSKINLSELSLAIGLSEGDTADAVEYWVTCGLLSHDEHRLSPSLPTDDYLSFSEGDLPIQEQPPAAESQVTAAPAPTAATSPTSSSSSKRKDNIRYSYDECMDMLSEDCDLRQMLTVIEGIILKPLNHTEISVFVTLVRYYGLPTGCVAMLVEYCRNIGKPSIAYIEQTGRGWAQDEITTIEKASKKISDLISASNAWNTVRNALDIPERKPTKRESELCHQWIDIMHIDLELIKLAYDRCVDTKGRMSMSYMNGIISNWHKKGITTCEAAIEDISSATSSAGAKKGTEGRYAPTYDKQELETMLLQEWLEDSPADDTSSSTGGC